MGSTLEKLSVSLGHTEGLSFVLLFGLIRFSSLDLYRLSGAKAFWLLVLFFGFWMDLDSDAYSLIEFTKQHT